jgi:hypothetical protein
MTTYTNPPNGDTSPPATVVCRHCALPIRRIAIPDLRGLGARSLDAHNRMLNSLREEVGGDTIWITVGDVERYTCASGNLSHEPMAPSLHRIVLDATTDASLAALAPDLHDRLLVDRIRASVAEQFPDHRTPVGVLFTPCAEDDHGSYLGGEGVVLFSDGTVDGLYDEELDPILGHRWPNVGREFLLTVDLRGQGNSTHTNAGSPPDIHTHFGLDVAHTY